MKKNHDSKIAVLIDAQSVNSKCIGKILYAIKDLGTPIVLRVYNDWNDRILQEWKKPMLENHITPVQQFVYSDAGGNDGTMIIDAMDMLRNDSIDTFCLISNNICYARLVTRLIENDRTVIGIGRKETDLLLKSAFSKFFCIDNLSAAECSASVCEGDECECRRKRTDDRWMDTAETSENKNDDSESALIELLKETIGELADTDGWSFMADVGNSIMRNYPDFNPQDYGYVKLTPLVKSLSSHFEIQEREVDGNERIRHIFVRNID